MAMLAAFGYNTAADAVQTDTALDGLKYLMSFIPAAIAVVSILILVIYPLDTKRMEKINSELKERRNNK
jgi:GPH family glycoside/pentoside/hexuronide:cation symporter